MEYHLVLYLLTLLGCGLLHFQAHGSLACLEEERVGLLKLKEAFNLPNGYSPFPSWGVEEIDCCRWERVTCDSMTQRVIGLYLSYAAVEPEVLNNSFLNASLFLPFQELQNLSLAWNFLKGLSLSLSHTHTHTHTHTHNISLQAIYIFVLMNFVGDE